MKKTSQVYLDYAATTPILPEVVKKMEPYFSEVFGNPSSIHRWGQEAEAAIESQRLRISRIIHAKSEEIIFTSGGTDSDNLALRGTALAMQKAKSANHLLISPVEHHAVSQTARQLKQSFGFDVEFLRVDKNGMVDPDEVKRKIRPNTALVSIIHGNNEIGTINPISEIGEICAMAKVPFHSDCVQSAAHIEMDVDRDHLDLASIGGHKFYGPKGIGFLYLRKGTPILPIQTGGSQERAMRAGTQNVPYIVGLAEAFEITYSGLPDFHSLLIPLRDKIIEQVIHEIPEVRLTGHKNNRLPNHASFAFKNLMGNELVIALDQAGFACSSGSACKVGNPEPSETLMALGFDPEWTLGSLRVTLGRETKEEQVDQFLHVLPEIVKKLRRIR